MFLFKPFLTPILFLAPSQEINITEAFELADRTLQEVVAREPRIPAPAVNQIGIELGEAVKELYQNNKSCSRVRVQEVIKRAQLKLFFGAVVDLNDTADLYGDPEIDPTRIHYFQVFPQQDIWSCGYWSLVNAATMKGILAGANPILTPRTMLQHITTHIQPNVHDAVINWQLHQFILHQIGIGVVRLQAPGRQNLPTFEHLTILAQHPTLQLFVPGRTDTTLYYLGYHLGREHGLQLEINEFGPGAELLVRGGEGAGILDIGPIMCNRLLNTFRDHVQRNVPYALHFVSCISGWASKTVGDPSKDYKTTNGSHYILISVVKLRDRNPVMIVCDSINWPVRCHIPYIKFVYSRFIQPFYNRK